MSGAIPLLLLYAYTTWTGRALRLAFQVPILTSVIPQAFSDFLEWISDVLFILDMFSGNCIFCLVKYSLKLYYLNERIFVKYGVRVWTGLNWLMTRSFGGCSSEQGSEVSRVLDQKVFLLSKRQSSSQEWTCSVGLVIHPQWTTGQTHEKPWSSKLKLQSPQRSV